MIEKITVDLICQMKNKKLLDDNMAERYIYVLVSWIEKFITVGTIILISIVVQRFLPTLCFLLFFLKLRKRTGGYHLENLISAILV